MTDGVKLLIAARTADCEVNIHTVAHSMGAYVLREAFDDADDSSAANANWTVNQVRWWRGTCLPPRSVAGTRHRKACIAIPTA